MGRGHQSVLNLAAAAYVLPDFFLLCCITSWAAKGASCPNSYFSLLDD